MENKTYEISSEELASILLSHRNWLGSDGEKGERANLTDAVLNRAVLEGARLNRTTLVRAALTRANMEGAYLFRTNLKKANLREVNLRCAHLEEADLRGAKVLKAELLLEANQLIRIKQDMRTRIGIWLKRIRK